MRSRLTNVKSRLQTIWSDLQHHHASRRLGHLSPQHAALLAGLAHVPIPVPAPAPTYYNSTIVHALPLPDYLCMHGELDHAVHAGTPTTYCSC